MRVDQASHDEVLLAEDSLEPNLACGLVKVDLQFVTRGAKSSIDQDAHNSLTLQEVLELCDTVLLIPQKDGLPRICYF